MNGPRRLKYDDAFRRETGCDLKVEQQLVDRSNLSALREAVIARTAADAAGGAAVGTAWWLGGGGAVLTAALALGLWTGSGGELRTPTPVDAEVAVVSLPAPGIGEPIAPQPVAPQLAPAAAPVAEGLLDANPPVDPQGARGSLAPRDRPVAPPELAVAPPLPMAPPVEAGASGDGIPARPTEVPTSEASSGAARSGTLAYESLMMDQALASMESGRWPEASKAFQDYLSAYPRGKFRREANIYILECQVKLGNHSGVEALAAVLAEAPELSARRPDLLRIRAEALAALGRCDEANRVAEELPRKVSRAVREGCVPPPR